MTIAAADPATAAAEARPEGRRGGGYARYAAGKVVGSIGSLAFVLVVNFFLFRILPGDPARTLGRGRLRTAEQIEEFNETYGLNQSTGEQFVTFLQNTFSGDLGYSLLYRQPVSEVLADRMWPTLLLVGTSTVFAALIGVWLGIRSGWQRGGGFDKFSTSSSLTLYSMPEWWLGLVLIAVFAVGAGPLPGLFPTGGLHSVDSDPSSLQGVLDTAWHLTLPVITLTLAYLADYTLIMRGSLIDEIGSDYLTTARAKGLRDVAVRNRHAVPNALAADDHGGGAESRVRRHRSDHDRDHLLDPRVGPAHRGSARSAGLLAAAGRLPAVIGWCDPRQPGRQPALRLARPPGAGMTTTAVRPLSTRSSSRVGVAGPAGRADGAGSAPTARAWPDWWCCPCSC